jgi:hypothetical protein
MPIVQHTEKAVEDNERKTAPICLKVELHSPKARYHGFDRSTRGTNSRIENKSARERLKGINACHGHCSGIYLDYAAKERRRVSGSMPYFKRSIFFDDTKLPACTR